MLILEYYKMLCDIYTEQISLTNSKEKKSKINQSFQGYLEIPNNLNKTKLNIPVVLKLLNDFEEDCTTILSEKLKKK